MNLSPHAALAFLQRHLAEEPIYVPITKLQHDELLAALRAAGSRAAWNGLEIDSEIHAMVNAVASLDLAMSTNMHFPETGTGSEADRWAIVIYPRPHVEFVPNPAKSLPDAPRRFNPSEDARGGASVAPTPVLNRFKVIGEASNKSLPAIPVRGLKTA
jgi:hypothetical protein